MQVSNLCLDCRLPGKPGNQQQSDSKTTVIWTIKAFFNLQSSLQCLRRWDCTLGLSKYTSFRTIKYAIVLQLCRDLYPIWRNIWCPIIQYKWHVLYNLFVEKVQHYCDSITIFLQYCHKNCVVVLQLCLLQLWLDVVCMTQLFLCHNLNSIVSQLHLYLQQRTMLTCSFVQYLWSMNHICVMYFIASILHHCCHLISLYVQ